MPSRVNHVKLICPHPEVVNAFLTQVCDVPEGWPLRGGAPSLAPDAPLGPGGDLPQSAIGERRLVSGDGGGFIAGDPSSRQFQILEGGPSAFWAICVSTRYIEDVLERARARGIPCSPLTIADWNEHDNIANFFCVVDGLMFEIIRVEPKHTAR